MIFKGRKRIGQNLLIETWQAVVSGFAWARFRPVCNQITRKTGVVLGVIDCFSWVFFY
jgi:hypothetical protein